ncbi:MAG: SPOR domain-containing protein [Treponema sp.]|jgi:hypothetical protein|nr:SPOR domain-containing protein [Treponema sp.]
MGRDKETLLHKIFSALLWAFCALSLQRVYAETAGSAFLNDEIKQAEQIVQMPQASGADKHTALVKLARLFQLSGSIEKAAVAWTDAAFAEAGKRDDDALLESACCYIAIGEMEKADASIKTVLLTGRNSEAVFNARYLAAQLAAFKSGEITLLLNLTRDPEYAPCRPAMYYTLWKVSGDEQYRAKLLAEYPRSPEALIINDGQTTGALSSAMWLLFPGNDAPPAQTQETHDTQVVQDEKPAPPVTMTGIVLQAGLFSLEENARDFVTRLRAAGFDPFLQERNVNGSVYWAVLVPAGADVNLTMRNLKQKGFDSFPITIR